MQGRDETSFLSQCLSAFTVFDVCVCNYFFLDWLGQRHQSVNGLGRATVLREMGIKAFPGTDVSEPPQKFQAQHADAQATTFTDA